MDEISYQSNQRAGLLERKFQGKEVMHQNAGFTAHQSSLERVDEG
jgi:hypothetical protein